MGKIREARASAAAKSSKQSRGAPAGAKRDGLAQRLGITDPKAMKAFIVDFLRLEPGYQGLPVPPPDASRCQLCRRKVFLDSKDKKECNGLCISGVKAKTILALRGQGKTIALGRTGGQHVTTYTAMSQHAREWHRTHRRRRRRPDVRDVLGEPARGASGRDGAGAGGRAMPALQEAGPTHAQGRVARRQRG